MNKLNIIINVVLTISVLIRPSDQQENRELVCHIPVVTSTALIHENDVTEVMDLLKKTFFVEEPLNKAINLCPGGLDCPELEEFCRKDLLSGYSLIETDKDGKIMAVSISGLTPLKEANDGNDLYSQAQKSTNPKFQKILHILANREKKSKLWEKYPGVTNMVEIKIVATRQDCRQKGLMTKLINETVQLGRRNNMHLVGIGTSNNYTAKGVEKNGFTLIYKELYTNITMNDQPLIVPEEPHKDDRFYVKQIN